MTQATNPTHGDPRNPVALEDLPPEVRAQVEAVRIKVHAAFGQIALSMMLMPRYRHLNIADLRTLAFEPLIRDRVALTSPPDGDDATGTGASAVIWATVNETVDTSIREQISSGVFPVRLSPEDWTSGEITWILDIIAPDADTAKKVLTSIGSLVKGKDVRIHPVVTRLIGRDALETLGARSSRTAEEV